MQKIHNAESIINNMMPEFPKEKFNCEVVSISEHITVKNDFKICEKINL